MSDTRVPQIFPPGEILREELEAREWSQGDLAEILGRPVKMVNEVIAGKRMITPETAQGLAEALGTSAELWLNLESQYQLYKARRTDEGVARRARLFELAPVKEMQRRGWLPETKAVEDLEAGICQFYGVGKTTDIHALPHAAKKSTSYDEDATPAQRAWVQRVLNLGASIDAGRFSQAAFDRAIERLGALRHAAPETRHVARVLAEAGIRLVIVEPLTGTKIDGVCVWADATSPVIGLSLRFDRIDSFWFALMHEMGHVRAGDGKEHPIVDLDLVGEGAIPQSEKPEAERLADRFAANFLVPEHEISGFIARVRPFYSKDRIRGFAARLQIHPGLVVGQLHFRGQIKYWHSREMLEKVRATVAESALTDGWNQTSV